MFYNSIIFAWKSLKKNRKRSILTVFGVVVGVACVSLIISTGKGFKGYLLDSINPRKGENVDINIFFTFNDISNKNINDNIFLESELSKIRFFDGVKDVKLTNSNIEFKTLNINLKEKKLSAGVELKKENGKKVLFGREIDKIDIIKGNKVALLSKDFLVDNFGVVENFVGSNIEINGIYFTIVGIFDNEKKLNIANVKIPEYAYVKSFGEEKINSQITVTIKHNYKPSEVAKNVVDFLNEEGSKNSIGKYSFVDVNLIIDGIASIINAITFFIACVGGISLFIAGIGIMNMMYTAVSDRTKEIIIRRSIGASKKNIREQFILEGVIITTLGGLIGYILGFILSYFISLFLPYSVIFEFETVAICIIISIIIGLIFSYSPAEEACKKDINQII